MDGPFVWPPLDEMAVIVEVDVAVGVSISAIGHGNVHAYGSN